MTLEISNAHPIPTPGTRKGFTQTLREMHKGDSVEVPSAKKASIYGAAQAAGVKVRTRSTDDGTVRVWRIDGPENLDIFGDPIKPKPAAGPGGPAVPAPSAPVPAALTTLAQPTAQDPKPKSKAAAAKSVPPADVVPRPKGAGYYQPNQWSARVWYDDLSKAPATTKDTVFS